MKHYIEADVEKETAYSLSDSDVVYALNKKAVDSQSLIMLKESLGVSGEVLSGWLHITPKTLRSYLTKKTNLSDIVGEQVLLLTALYRHGKTVFGSVKTFEAWLGCENGMLDGKKPMDLLGTVSGIRLIDSRLYGLEYGDNA
jgi:uncharacterized protein (DUF2384 family)